MHRFKLLGFIFPFFSLIFLTRLFYWQIIKGSSITAIAEEEHTDSFTVPARRGVIRSLDNFNLVGNKEDYLLYATVPDIKDPPNTSRVLADIIASNRSLDRYQIQESTVGGVLVKEEIPADPLLEKDLLYEKILDRLDSPGLVWVALEDKIDPKTKEIIESKNIKGLAFEEENSRFYPEGSTAAHILGFVGKDNQGREKGYFGLEGYYDRELRGVYGQIKQEKDVFGNPIVIGSYSKIPPIDGRNLTTTIDRAVQYIVENYLKAGIEKWNAQGGSVTVINPKDGSIMAMSSFPSYNPANWENYDSAIFKNPVISDVFEPGSIMKPLIMAAAINEEKIKPDTTCPVCSGARSIGGFTIRTFNDQYHPNLKMTQVLENSDNTGMIFVGEKLGLERIFSYFQKYGFGQKTNIDLEGEEHGTVKEKKDWKEIDLATSTFGQGIGVTQMQMLKAFGAIANGGFLVTPHVVVRKTDANREYEVSYPSKERVLKEETTKALKDMLVSVTEKSPLHYPRDLHPDLLHYRIAAKSGTAQIPISGHYDPTKTIGSVIGFAPADDPKFLVLVRLLEPAVRPWGSDTAGPIFFNIVDSLLKYYGIAPN